MNRRLPYRAQLTSKASEVLRIGTRDVWICSTVEQIVSFVIGTSQSFGTVYDTQGNILSNTLAGTYSYDSGKPHAVTEVTPSNAFPNAISAADCETDYNVFNQPSRIAEGDVEILLEYGADNQRVKAVFKNCGHVVRTRYYISENYEKEIDSRGAVFHYHYIYGSTGLAAICVRRNGVDSMYYVHPDRLGSYTHITDSSRRVIRALHFDPWGNVKSDADWKAFVEDAPVSLTSSFRFSRGFTSHEHYADLKIINMNGRLYDPVIARFFSPDNFVQAPEFTQSYNRYSYCLNNPLQYTDPSGESFLAAAFAIGALTNVFFQMISGNINSAGDFLLSAGFGGFAGMAGSAAGSAAAGAVGVGGFLGGAASGVASGAAAGAITGFGNSLIAGNNLNTAIYQGFWGGFIGALGGGLMGGLSRGILDARHGYNFWDGSFYEEFATGELVPDGDYAAIADYYNKSKIADQYDAVLINRYKEMFGIEIGDYNIKELTTRPSNFGSRSPIYGMNDKWQFVNIDGGYIVGGYTSGNSISGTHIHISPYSIDMGDVVFRALAGHELIHAYHHYLDATMGFAFVRLYSERVAYQHTFNTYISNGYVCHAVSAMKSALQLNFWGSQYPFFTPLHSNISL